MGANEEETKSGKFSLRMPKSLHAKAARVAELDGVSLNVWITSIIAERVGARHGDTEKVDTERG